MASEALDPDAAYGYLAFDIFLMERWDHTANPATDHEQWRSAVQAYLALTPRERFPYHREAWQRADHHYEYQADPDLAARLFVPYQTPRERNLSARRTDFPADPALLRTCYGPELDAAYTALAAPLIHGFERLVDPCGLDDPGLYGSCEGDWSRVLARIPELCDVVRWSVDEDYEREEQRMKEAEDGMVKLSMTVVANVYEVDAVALKEGWIKVLWLNCHGECVWHNRVRHNELLEFAGACDALVMLDQILDSWAEGKEKGARLTFH